MNEFDAHLRRAIKVAADARAHGNHPFGAVLVAPDGAIVLEATEQPGETSDRGILTSSLRSDGSHKEKLYVDGGPSTTQTAPATAPAIAENHR